MVAVAATIEKLQWKCNETLEIVSQSMKEHGLKLAQEKNETVLVTKRKKFEYPKLVLDGHKIQLDRHWSNDAILNSVLLFNWAKSKFENIQFFHYTREDYR